MRLCNFAGNRVSLITFVFVATVLKPAAIAQAMQLGAQWSSTGNLNAARYLHTATRLLNGKVLVAGGSTGRISLNSAELYDPATGEWSVTGSLNIGRCWHTATLLPSGKVLVAGGLTSGTPTSFTNSAELYDPATGTWSSAGSLNTDRAVHTATLLRNGKVLVAGGTNDVHNFAVDEDMLNSAELYDPNTGAWSISGNLNTERDAHSATLLEDGKVLVTGGGHTAELYDPTSETWSSTGNLNVYGAAQVATLLPDGTVLLTGGWTGRSPLETAELYNPLTSTWSRTSNLQSRRYHHTATVLYGGKVLVTGGDYGAGRYLNSVELYDSATGSWITSASLAVARVSHTATLLPNGQVLVVGGYNSIATLDSTELYTPQAGVPGEPTLQFSTSRYSLVESGGNATISVVRLGDLSGAASVDYATSDGTALQRSDYNPSFGTLRFATGEESKAFMVPIRDDGDIEGSETVLIALSQPNGAALGGSSLAILTITDNDTGLPVTNPTWVSTGKLNTARHLHTATLLPDGKVLVAGGYTGTTQPSVTVTNSAELYDPATSTWSVTGNLITSRVLHTATVLPNGKVLVIGGNTSTAPPSFGVTSSAELYDPQTGTWSAAGNLNGSTTWHTATLLPSGKVLVTGGWSGNSALKKVELYNPDTSKWSVSGSLIAARYGHTATLLENGQVLVAGGSDDGDLASTLASAELYDPDTGTWSTTGSLNRNRISHTATLLPDGKVLVAGGYDWPPISLNSAELYDPTTGKWSIIGNLNADRDSHTATLLPGGKVLLAGGYDWNRRASPPSTDLYDAASGKWSSMAAITTARSAHTATLLLNGKVLIAGGAIQNDSLNSAELFDPGLAQLGAGVPRLLIPSSVYSDEFVSSLVILNIDSEPNSVTIHASNHLGDSIGSMAITLRAGERFRTANILRQLGAAPGSSGPILVSSNNGRLLSAMSEVVSSSRGAAGVFPAVNLDTAWTEGFLLEATDSGPRGMPGTHRTNLGLINTSGSSATNVTMTLFNSSGQQVGNPLTIPIGIDCYTGCPEQINTIVQRLRGSAGVTEGYVKISSQQPIIAWASKIENGTEDPSFPTGIGAASLTQQEIRHDVGTRLLVPSSAYSDIFTSSLVVLNMDSQPNNVTLTAYDTGGKPAAAPLRITLPVGGEFRSNNILQQLGAAFGSFGPIKVESGNNRLLSAVSEVRSQQGFAGFFQAVNVETAWTQGFILEATDSGPRGTAATYRTNLGLNSVGSGSTNVTITLFNDSGQQVGNSISTTVASNGLTQLDHIVQRLRGSEAVSGGYLRVVSTRPIIAWASKVENGTDDPSIQLAIGVSSLATQGVTFVDLNGTYLAPSPGDAISDGVASATTHPLGDRRGQGQVYELNKGILAPDGTYTPFSDDGRKPHWLFDVDLRDKSFQCDVDLHEPNLWLSDAEFFQIGAGRQADWSDTQTEEFFVFIYRYGRGFALYMETDWAEYRPETTYYAAADETKFHVGVEVNAAGTEALLTVIPLNGMAAGTVHTVNSLPLDATNDNVTSASFFAGFTQNYPNINSTAKATISNFVITNAIPNAAGAR